jgi:hypothetical protein
LCDSLASIENVSRDWQASSNERVPVVCETAKRNVLRFDEILLGDEKLAIDSLSSLGGLHARIGPFGGPFACR